jgi:hypothetical protein
VNWLIYWFMFPACVAIAGIATFSGISGAALLTPLFLIGFPLLGRPAAGDARGDRNIAFPRNLWVRHGRVPLSAHESR